MNNSTVESPDQSGIPGMVMLVAGPVAAPSSQQSLIEQWISDAGLEVVRCPDVYLALARSLKGQPSCAAMVVAVDELAASHFEFFVLMARMRRDLSVFVFGRNPERIVKALESGARGLVSPDTLVSVASSMRRRTELPVRTPVAPDSPVVAPQEISRPVASVPSVAPEPAAAPTLEGGLRDEIFRLAEPQTRAAEAQPDAEDLSSLNQPVQEPPKSGDDQPGLSARVPWLRYTGGPVRHAPGAPARPARERIAPTAQPKPERAESIEPKSANGQTHVDDVQSLLQKREYEPLLTEQELAALLGDDLDEVALQEREMLTGDGESPGGAAR